MKTAQPYEYRHSLRGESKVRVLIYVQPESFCRGLQEVSVPAEHCVFSLKSFTPPVMQDDDFDVLSAHATINVRIS